MKWASQQTAWITYAMCSVMTGTEVLIQVGGTGRSRITSSHRHTKSIAIYGSISSGEKRNLKTVRMTSSHQEDERETSSRKEGKAETQSHHKPYSLCGNLQFEGNSQLPVPS